ncbi:MAG: YihY/virulence factor BrkB family protein [Acidobacteriota bacterium]
MKLLTFQWKIFFHRLYYRVFDTDLFNRSAQVAFYFSFALFPLLFFLVSVFGLVIVSTEGLKGELFSYIHQLLPNDAYDLVRKTVEEIAETSSPGKVTIGLTVTLWSSSAGVDSIRNALNAVYELRETRSWFVTKALSLAITFLLIIFTAFVLGVVFYGWRSVQFFLLTLGLTITSPWILITIQWISIIVVLLVACEILYNIVPNFKRFRWNWITVGSLVSIILFILLTGLFRIYLQYFNSYNRTYGSLGAVIILMLWLYLTAVAIMVGGAINGVLHGMDDERSQDEDASLPDELLAVADSPEQ